MDTAALLEELRARVRGDLALRERFMETRTSADPVAAFCFLCRELVDAFCKVCQAWGYEIYAMDLIGAGEEFYGNMRRSTNGGGENSPKLHMEDDFYELFFVGL